MFGCWSLRAILGASGYRGSLSHDRLNFVFVALLLSDYVGLATKMEGWTRQPLPQQYGALKGLRLVAKGPNNFLKVPVSM